MLARLCDHPEVPARRILTVMLLVMAPIVVNNLVRGQTNIAVLFLITLSLAALAQGRDLRAGAWLGVATAFKLTPAFFCGYLVLLRRWKALLAMVTATVAFLVLPPLLVFGPERARGMQERWWRKVNVPYAREGGEAVLEKKPYRDSNQSATAVLTRLLTDAKDGAAVNVTSWPEPVAKRIARGVAGVLVALVCRRAVLGRTWSLEAAAVAGFCALAMPMVSDISWTSHYVVATIAVAAAVALFQRTPRPRTLSYGLLASAVLYAMSGWSPVKERGGLCFAVLALFLALATALLAPTRRRDAGDPSPSLP